MCAGRALAGREELDRTYRTAANCCRYAQLAGVAQDRLDAFQALLPRLAQFKDDE